MTARTVAPRPRECQLALLDGERAFHSGRRMAGHGAEIGGLALLQRDGELRALARFDERRLLAGNLEVVRKLALVHDREDDLASKRIHNDRLFFVGAIIINHLVSAVSSVILTNKHNSEIRKGSGGFSLSAGVIKNFNHIDGLKLTFVKSF